MVNKKKTEIINPAETYLESAQNQSENMDPDNHINDDEKISSKLLPTSYKAMLKQIEARSKRIQCLLQPSLYSRIKKKATSQEMSVNDYIHSVLEISVNSKSSS
jgi:predicted DNA binding CopG/RHH family protein